MMIDTHFHIPDNINDLDQIIKDAKDNNVLYMITAGTDVETNKTLIDVTNKYNNLFLGLGYHPEYADSITDKDINLLEEQIIKYHPVSIGEIGLDYHYTKDNKEKQISLFKKQLDLATKYNLPVVIHSREATNDTINILKQYNLTGTLHCFSGSLEVAREYIRLGYLLGIGGVITFKNSNLGDVIKQIDLNNIVLETDSPYLSPIRGEVNYPKNIKIINNYIAELTNKENDEIAEITSNNAIRLFDLKIDN